MEKRSETIDPDFELCVRLADGDHASFSEMYSKYNHKVYGFILKYIHSPELTKDLTQEVFIKIWENRAQLHEVRSLRAYILTIARNHTLNTLKKMASIEVAQSHLLTFFDSNREIVLDDFISQEYMELLEIVLARLPDRTREIFRMCRQEGKSYDEAAAALGISRNAIKNHMVFSMKVLSDFAEKDLHITLSLLLVALYYMALFHPWITPDSIFSKKNQI